MQIEIFENIDDSEGLRLELRSYQISDGVQRVLVDKSRGSGREVWGFDANGKQHEGELISVDPHCVIVG